MCAYCACTVHMQTHFTTLCLWWLRPRCFPNPCQSDIWLTTARRNSYQPVIVCIYRNSVIMEAWFPFMNMHPCMTLEYASSEHHCHANCGAIALITSTTYMTIVELFDEYPVPFSPEMTMTVIDHDTNIYIKWHHIINGNRKEHQSLLLRGIGSGPGPSSPPSCILSWHGD